MKARYPAQKVVVGIEALSRLVLRTLYLGLFQLRRDRSHDARGHLVLQIEDVVERTPESVRPEMRPRYRKDQLRRDSHPVCCLTHATFEHVAYPQFATDLLHAYCPTLVGEA
jgi:hypothetical protein